MSGRVGISWWFNQEQQQVCQEPETSTADEATDEEIYNNKLRAKQRFSL